MVMEAIIGQKKVQNPDFELLGNVLILLVVTNYGASQQIQVFLMHDVQKSL